MLRTGLTSALLLALLAAGSLAASGTKPATAPTTNAADLYREAFKRIEATTTKPGWRLIDFSWETPFDAKAQAILDEHHQTVALFRQAAMALKLDGEAAFERVRDPEGGEAFERVPTKTGYELRSKLKLGTSHQWLRIGPEETVTGK